MDVFPYNKSLEIYSTVSLQPQTPHTLVNKVISLKKIRLNDIFPKMCGSFFIIKFRKILLFRFNIPHHILPLIKYLFKKIKLNFVGRVMCYFLTSHYTFVTSQQTIFTISKYTYRESQTKNKLNHDYMYLKS